MPAVPDDSEAVDLTALLRCVAVDRGTRKRWVRPGLLVEPADGRYFERQVVESALVAALVHTLPVADVARIWPEQGGALTDRALAVKTGHRLDLLVATGPLWTAIVTSAATLDAAVVAGEPFVVVELADRVRRARNAFARFKGTIDFAGDRRRSKGARGTLVDLDERRSGNGSTGK